MEQCHGNLFLYLASPAVGNDVNGLIRELAALDGICRVVPMSRFCRLLRVDYDRRVIAVWTLVNHVQRGWSAARPVAV
jgi:hypothetical protein